MENIIQFSDSRSTFMKAFFEARKNIGKITKKRENDHLKSKYANLADYFDAIDSAIEDQGLMVIQSAGRFTEKGDLPMETRIEHVESGEFMVAVMEIHVDKKTAQGDGSAQSYAKRYHIGSLFGIATSDDDGHGAKRKAKDYIKEFDLITDLKELKDEARAAYRALSGQETEQNLITTYVTKREAEAAVANPGFVPAKPQKREVPRKQSDLAQPPAGVADNLQSGAQPADNAGDNNPTRNF